MTIVTISPKLLLLGSIALPSGCQDIPTKKSARKYGAGASRKVAEVMHEFKQGTLRSLACALMAVACSRASSRPAQDAASGTTAIAPSHSNPTVTTAMEPAAAMPNNTVEKTTTGNNEVAGAYTNFTPNRVTPAVDKTPSVAEPTNNADNTMINSRDRHDTLGPMESRE